MPYLADTKIAVEFNSIVINTDYQLISGTVETSYDAKWGNVVDGKEIINDLVNDAKDVVDKILDLLAKDEVLEKQKLEGTIDDNEYAKGKKEVWDELNQANTQYKELAKISGLPEDLQKRRDSLDPIFVDSASNSGASTGNQSEENKKEIGEVYTDIATFIKNNCQDLDKGKIIIQDANDYKMYSTPTGSGIIIKNVTNVSLESIYPNESYPDLNVPKGCLVAFTKDSHTFRAKYKKESNKWQFIGYVSKEGIEYLDTDTDEQKNKLEATGNNEASIQLVLGAGASEELAKRVVVNIGGRAILTAEGALAFRSITGVAMLGYIIMETFVVTTTVTSHYGDVLDIPVQTPIVIQSVEDDGYVANPPVDVPITIPHALPKDETGKKGCQVYCIYKVDKDTKELTIAKYGMTCQENFKSEGNQDCNPRPEYQVSYFNKTEIKFKFHYTWVTPSEVSKETAYIIERSMIASYVISNNGNLPSHHKRPCFVVGDTFEKLQGRGNKALDWIKEQILKYGK